MAELTVAEALVIKPGDHLLVRVSHDVDYQEADELRQQLIERLPELAGVTVVIGADGFAVVRDEEHAGD